MKTKTAKPRILNVWIEHTYDDSPDTSYLGEYSNTPGENAIDRKTNGDWNRGEYQYFNPANAENAKANYERFEAYNNSQWHYIGIIAKAEVQLSENHVIQVLRSGGIWGVESDSDQEHLDSIHKEELDGLRAELELAGFGKRAIDFAFKNVETKS